MNWIRCPKGCGFEGASQAAVSWHMGVQHQDPPMRAKDGGPAFPIHRTKEDTGENGHIYYWQESDGGLSMRDYFAAAALTGMLARDSGPSIDVEKAAYDYADAMLAARSKTTEGE